jgi:hypothetical protein
MKVSENGDDFLLFSMSERKMKERHVYLVNGMNT